MIPELANDYSAYLKIDLTKELGTAKDSLEDMLTRLDEFQSLISMVQADDFQLVNSMAEEVIGRKGELVQLCERIDGLEALVGRVKRDMDSVESLLSAAEAESGASEGMIMKVLGPLFTKKPAADAVGHSSSRSSLTSPFTSPDIFSADKVFAPPSSSVPSASSQSPPPP